MFGKAVALFFTINCCSAGLMGNNLNNVEMPGDCHGKNYCFIESERYPRSLIDSHLEEFLGPLVEGSDSIANRNGPENPTDDCERLINFEPIYEIIDKNNNLRFVAQSDNKFLQKIRTESCLNPGRIKEHSRFFEPFQLNMWNFTCKETRIDYSFLVLSLDGNTLEDVDVKGGLPICCSCHLEDEEV